MCVCVCVCVCWRWICISLTRQLHQTRVILCRGRKPQRASQLGWNAQPRVGSMGELPCDFCSSMESEERGASAEKKIHQEDGEQGVLLSAPRHYLRCAPLLTFLAHICINVSINCVIRTDCNFKARTQSQLPSDPSASRPTSSGSLPSSSGFFLSQSIDKSKRSLQSYSSILESQDFLNHQSARCLRTDAFYRD